MQAILEHQVIDTLSAQREVRWKCPDRLVISKIRGLGSPSQETPFTYGRYLQALQYMEQEADMLMALFQGTSNQSQYLDYTGLLFNTTFSSSCKLKVFNLCTLYSLHIQLFLMLSTSYSAYSLTLKHSHHSPILNHFCHTLNIHVVGAQELAIVTQELAMAFLYWSPFHKAPASPNPAHPCRQLHHTPKHHHLRCVVDS